jgi:NADH:ubiquinone oxidoreductase subunit H
MCYDINMQAHVGYTYAGIMVLPTTAAEIEAAYLQNELAGEGGYNALVSVSGPISMAVWQLMDPSSQFPAPFDLDPAAADLVADAETAYSSGAWTQAMAAYYAFWEPITITETQRFGFVYGGPRPDPGDITTLPEPGSLVLFLLGGVLLAAGKIRS